MRNNNLLQNVLANVALTYQNVDSVELGVTSIDTYFDTLGGISRAVLQAKHQRDGNAASAPPVYVVDQTQGDGVVRSSGKAGGQAVIQSDDNDEEPVVIYHSHTASEAEPSATDRAAFLEPDVHYVIVTLVEHPQHEQRVRSWRLTDGGLAEEPVIVAAACG